MFFRLLHFILRRLGMELRALREAAGLNSQQAADVLGCSQSKISRVENGKSPVSVRDIRGLLGLYDVSDEEQRERLRRPGGVPGPRRASRSGRGSRMSRRRGERATVPPLAEGPAAALTAARREAPPRRPGP